MATSRRVVLVRHAERADENPGAAVSLEHFPEWDPPLTEIGVDQARRAAVHVGSKLSSFYSFSPAVYTSPFLRCVQTAHPFAQALHLPLVVDTGAGACAWAFKKSLRDEGRPPPFLGESALHSAAPGMELRFGAPRTEGAEDFVSFLASVAACAPPPQPAGDGHLRAPAVLVVTHREGLRELDRLCGVAERMATPYCVAREYDYDLSSGAFSVVPDARLSAPEARSLFYADGLEGRSRDREFAFA